MAEEIKEKKQTAKKEFILMANENIRVKLQRARMLLKKKNLTKSGKNSFLGNAYYQLTDIQPAITEVCFEVGICPIISFDKEQVIMTIYDFDSEETLDIIAPMADVLAANDNGNKKKSIMQEIMSNETYARRAMFLNVFEIVEEEEQDNSVDIDLHDILMVKTRIERTMTELLKNGYDFDEVLKSIGLDEKKYNGFLNACNTINKIENNMKVLLKNDKSKT